MLSFVMALLVKKLVSIKYTYDSKILNIIIKCQVNQNKIPLTHQRPQFFLYPLRTSENICFFSCFQGV